MQIPYQYWQTLCNLRTFLQMLLFMGNKSQQSMFLTPTDPNEVVPLIELIKRKNCSGHDGITPALTKDIKYEI